ncbi:glycosyltransferase [Heyndrickxia coagulans]|uniref:glycosyltransferase n=1 Tax=Heyndrickxia coagulans TaxID=1398 RepID=UPI0015FCEA71|nr:glycosyltransferase [Heyndrickxia coagulans]
MKPKIITVFTEGDSNKLSTWSNVPFFLTNTLEKKGYIINRVDVNSNKIIRGIYNKIILKIIKRLFNKKTEYYLNRTTYFEKRVERKMKRATKKYKDTDIFISTSFSYSPWKFTNKKTVLFCDWTIDYYYKYFLNRKPDRLERGAIERQDTQIDHSDYVISLFPDVTNYMKEKYSNKNIFYLGNVINSVLDVNMEQILKSKLESFSILFIGGKKYIEGAKSLIMAYDSLKLKYPRIIVNIIGISKEQFSYLPSEINCYGYLDKSKEKDKRVYYRLMSEAKLIINTTPKWAAFSATVEAMYWYTPVITTPYASFVKTFGTNINFGYYCEKNDPELINRFISKILQLSDSDYLNMCQSANKVVQQFSWDNYVNKLLKAISE